MKTMQVAVRETDNLPGGNWLLALVIEQENSATFERNPNLLGGGMTMRRIGRSGHREDIERFILQSISKLSRRNAILRHGVVRASKMKSPADWRGLNWRAWPGLARSGTRIER